MKKLTLTLTVTALVLGSMVLSANAQTQALGAASIHAQVQNATPIVKQAACRGRNAHCGSGWTWVCAYGVCACRPCL